MNQVLSLTHADERVRAVADAPTVMCLRDTLQAHEVPDITVGTGVLPIQIEHTMAMVQRALTVIPDLTCITTV